MKKFGFDDLTILCCVSIFVFSLIFALGGIEMLGFISIFVLFGILVAGVAKCQLDLDCRPIPVAKKQLYWEFAVPVSGLISVGIALLLLLKAITFIPVWMAIPLVLYLAIGIGIIPMSIGWLGRVIQDAIWLKGVLKTKTCLS